MSRGTENEMEQIQRGLEDFLEKELASGNRRQKEKGENTVKREPQFYDMENWDAADRPRRRKPPQKGAGEKSRGAQKKGGGSGGTRKSSGGKAGGQKRTAGRSDGNRSPREDDSGKGAGNWSPRQTGSGKSAGNRSRKRVVKKKSPFFKVLIALALILVLLAAGLYSLAGVVYNKLNYVEIESVAGFPMKEDGVTNILLIGNDSRENGDDGRSDAMILLSVSGRTKTIYMTSLLRDMYVDIPGHKGNRLNAAYSLGGAELLMETIEQNFDIPVNRYVLVNFEAFAGLVDAVGGVDLELSRGEKEYVNAYLVEYNMLTDRPQGTDDIDASEDGMVHLNGPQALAYCRNRYMGTDFGRTERQRKVLAEVVRKIPRGLVTNGADIMNALMPNLTTNLTKNECISLGLTVIGLLNRDIAADSIPQPGTYSNATIRTMSVLKVDFEANQKYLKEKLYGGE